VCSRSTLLHVAREVCSCSMLLHDATHEVCSYCDDRMEHVTALSASF
jgi:hypothetical protein